MKQNPLKRVIAWLDLHLEETILIITGSLIGIVIMMQIIMRYVFRHALPWPEEFCRFCYIYFCFISLGYAVRNRCLLNITLLQDHLPPRSPYGVGYPHSSIHADRVYHILWGQHRLCESHHHFRPAFPRTADPHDYPFIWPHPLAFSSQSSVLSSPPSSQSSFYSPVETLRSMP